MQAIPLVTGKEETRRRVEELARRNLLHILAGRVPRSLLGVPGLRYRLRECGKFTDAVDILRCGGGSCESLVAYLLAEAWAAGLRAWAVVQDTPAAGFLHVLAAVKTPGGVWMVDPSAILYHDERASHG